MICEKQLLVYLFFPVPSLGFFWRFLLFWGIYQTRALGKSACQKVRYYINIADCSCTRHEQRDLRNTMTTIKGKHVKDKDQIKYMKIRNDELEFLDKVSGHLKECNNSL